MLRIDHTKDGLWLIRLAQDGEYNFINQLLLQLTLLTTFIPAFLFLVSILYMQVKKIKIKKLDDFVSFIAWYQVLMVSYYTLQFFLINNSLINSVEPLLPQFSILISFFITYRGRYNIIGFKLPTSIIKSVVLIIFMYIMVVLFVDHLITKPITEFLHLDTASWREQEISSQIVYAKAKGLFKSLVEVFMIGILVPIAEEIMFRGVIQTEILYRFGRIASIILTSLLFALIHIDPILMASIFFIGLILSWSRDYFDSLTPPILFHMIMNTTTTIIYLIQ